MPRLPADISGQDAVKAFQRAGWTVARYGPHIIMEKEGMRSILSVPNHRILAKGTLRALIRYAQLSVEEFLRFLE